MGTDRLERHRRLGSPRTTDPPLTGPVVILGSGRSGTSLVGQLFERLMPYRFEPKMAQLRPPPSRRECWKLPWDDDRRTPGCRVDINELAALDAHVVWMIRHPLDYTCSAVPLWNARPNDEATTGGSRWIYDQAGPLIAGLVSWLTVNHQGLQTAKTTIRNLHIVRYEDVVATPGWTARLLLDATNIDYNGPIVDAWAATAHNTKRRDDEDPRQADLWWRNDHDIRVGRWQQNLTPEAVAPLWTIVAPVAEQHGYTLDTPPPRGHRISESSSGSALRLSGFTYCDESSM